ncbi:neuropeptide CCHamide-1 isoform X2 [Amyelois transitella]|uniref:neuropeptide CCHamide-1 isoform X2 n=1 Tax=Amyelois transitella TaxID=680683 RepID=UPI00067ABB6B|nr:neuropeptide CCHamide-1 isoform X2 [Amyelois transitella]
MDRISCSRRAGPRSAPTAWVLALLLVICLAESATGSCLSYGHSCWGAHGKRSGRPPVSAPDWYLTRMLRKMVSSSNELFPTRHLSQNDDTNAIFQVEVPDDSLAPEGITANEDSSIDNNPRRNVEAKPMLDDELLAKIKLWQMMKEASEKK